MTSSVATRTTGAVARPPRVLVPLIQKELADGQAAGVEHYRRAGELLNEAKAGVSHGEWTAWLVEHFDLSSRTATRYMRLAGQAEEVENGHRRPISTTLSAAVDTPREHHQPAWHRPVLHHVARVDTDRLAQEARDVRAEAKLVRDLAAEIINIGYKALATRLHPDKRDGSAEAMTRLNRARALLRGAL
jgi:DUF3102 family protein